MFNAKESLVAIPFYREIVIKGLRKALKLISSESLEPYKEQVDVLYTLIFAEQDVFYITRTGTSKSLIF